jgi:hypothetical protein
MRSPFALSLALLLSFSASAASQATCEPTIVKSGREETIWVKDTRVIGDAAIAEMKATGKAVEHRDALGRVMYVDSRVLVRTIDGESAETSAKGIYPMARIERYCSSSNEVDATCVDLCIRWTNYKRF